MAKTDEVSILNVAGEKINSATQETLAAVLALLQDGNPATEDTLVAGLAALVELLIAGLKAQNTEGAVVNPATEDTLALIKTALDPPSRIIVGTKAGVANGISLYGSVPSKYVWLGAPETNGVATNLAPVYVGGIDGQVIPIMPDNFEGICLHESDPSRIYIKSATGESIRFAIFQA